MQSKAADNGGFAFAFRKDGYPTRRRVAAGKHRRITTNCNATTIELYCYSSGAFGITTNLSLSLGIIPYSIIQSQQNANKCIAVSIPLWYNITAVNGGILSVYGTKEGYQTPHNKRTKFVPIFLIANN